MRNSLIQRLTIDGRELDLGLFERMTYVETMDLSGPRLLLRASDRHRILRDDFGLVEGVMLVAKINDGETGGGLDIVEAFTVKTVDSDAQDTLIVECMSSVVDALKSPMQNALFVNRSTPAAILARAAPGVTLDVGNFPLVDAWHLMPGERTSRRLRQLARELGAACWYSRGKLHLHALSSLWSRPAVLTLHQGDRERPKKQQITDYQVLYRKEIIRDRIERRYVGWDMTRGVVMSGGEGPVEFTQYHQRAQLTNLRTSLVPAIDMAVAGQGELEVGQKLGLKFHRARQGRPFDESLPPDVLITTMAYQQGRDQYRSRIKGGIIHV